MFPLKNTRSQPTNSSCNSCVFLYSAMLPASCSGQEGTLSVYTVIKPQRGHDWRGKYWELKITLYFCRWTFGNCALHFCNLSPAVSTGSPLVHYDPLHFFHLLEGIDSKRSSLASTRPLNVFCCFLQLHICQTSTSEFQNQLQSSEFLISVYSVH